MVPQVKDQDWLDFAILGLVFAWVMSPVVVLWYFVLHWLGVW